MGTVKRILAQRSGCDGGGGGDGDGYGGSIGGLQR